MRTGFALLGSVKFENEMFCFDLSPICGQKGPDAGREARQKETIFPAVPDYACSGRWVVCIFSCARPLDDGGLEHASLLWNALLRT